MSEFFRLVATGAITSTEEPSGVGNSRVTLSWLKFFITSSDRGQGSSGVNWLTFFIILIMVNKNFKIFNQTSGNVKSGRTPRDCLCDCFLLLV